jgi:hypothetical protein
VSGAVPLLTGREDDQMGIQTRSKQMAKQLGSEHVVIFWGSKRILREPADKAFDKVGMANLLPPVDHYAALHKAAGDIVTAYNVGGGEGVKKHGLSGKADAVGVEVRRFVRGKTRNELPFLFSMGVCKQTDGSYAVEILDVDSAECSEVHKNRKTIERQADRYWREACTFLSANDLTNAITGLVKASHGFLLRDEGVVWYLPEDKLDAYISVADDLREHGVVMQTVRFNPTVNSALIKHVSDELTRRSMAVFQGQIEQADDMAHRGAKARSNGQQTRLEQWIAAHETLEHNKALLGKGFAQIAKAAAYAKEKIGSVALSAFAG